MGVRGTHSDGVPIVAYCVRRAGGETIAARHPGEPFYAASTVKLAVLAATARALDRGDVSLDTVMTSTDTFRSEAPGAPDYRIDPDDIDPGLPPPGTAMPLGDVAQRMIVVSLGPTLSWVRCTNGASQSERVLPSSFPGMVLGGSGGGLGSATPKQANNIIDAAPTCKRKRMMPPAFNTTALSDSRRGTYPLVAAGFSLRKARSVRSVMAAG